MSLPSPWVDKIFTKLAVTYGQRFLGLYAGLDLQAVKDDWADELAGYAQSPAAIKHALGILPTDKPPTVLEFRQLCRSAPQYVQAQLPGPRTPPPPNLREAVAGIGKEGAYDPKEWAHKLKAREESGASLTMAQKQMWREALEPRGLQ
jgi:hypothetical protein